MAAVIENTVHPAFEKLRSHRISTLNVTVEEYRHRKTGARHLHLAADNDENVFFVALRTFPMAMPLVAGCCGIRDPATRRGQRLRRLIAGRPRASSEAARSAPRARSARRRRARPRSRANAAG